MVDPATALFFIGVVLSAIIAAVILKNVIKVVFTVLMVLMVCMLIFGLFAYLDAIDMRQRMQDSSNLFLLVENDTVFGGFEGTSLEQGSVHFLTGDELETAREQHIAGDYEGLLGDNYKIFIISTSAYDGVKTIDMNNGTYTKDYILGLVRSETPMKDFVTRVYLNLAIDFTAMDEETQELTLDSVRTSLGIRENQEFKGFLAAVLFSNALDKKGEFFLINQFRRGTVAVYPETTIFKFIKRVPSGLFDKAIENAKKKASESMAKLKQE